MPRARVTGCSRRTGWLAGSRDWCALPRRRVRRPPPASCPQSSSSPCCIPPRAPDRTTTSHCCGAIWGRGIPRAGRSLPGRTGARLRARFRGHRPASEENPSPCCCAARAPSPCSCPDCVTEDGITYVRPRGQIKPLQFNIPNVAMKLPGSPINLPHCPALLVVAPRRAGVG